MEEITARKVGDGGGESVENQLQNVQLAAAITVWSAAAQDRRNCNGIFVRDGHGWQTLI